MLHRQADKINRLDNVEDVLEGLAPRLLLGVAKRLGQAKLRNLPYVMWSSLASESVRLLLEAI